MKGSSRDAGALKNQSQLLVKKNNIKDPNVDPEAKTEILTHQGVELRMKHAMVRVVDC